MVVQIGSLRVPNIYPDFFKIFLNLYILDTFKGEGGEVSYTPEVAQFLKKIQYFRNFLKVGGEKRTCDVDRGGRVNHGGRRSDGQDDRQGIVLGLSCLGAAAAQSFKNGHEARREWLGVKSGREGGMFKLRLIKIVESHERNFKG